MFFKIGAFENSAIFAGKHLNWSLFSINSLFSVFFNFFQRFQAAIFNNFLMAASVQPVLCVLKTKMFLKKKKMLRNWTKWNEVASFLVNYFQHLFKVHHGCFWYWEIKVFSEITKKISIWYSKTQKRSQKSIRSIAVGLIFFFYLGFLSRTFTIHRTSGEGGAYLFDSSVTLPPALQTRRH